MRNTSDNIRKDSIEMVNLMDERMPRDHPLRVWFLLAQSLVVAVQECAAQLAEANERPLKEAEARKELARMTQRQEEAFYDQPCSCGHTLGKHTHDGVCVLCLNNGTPCGVVVSKLEERGML